MIVAMTTLPRRKTLLAPALIVGAALLVYSNGFHVAFVYDGVKAVLHNPTIRDLSRVAVVLSPPIQIPTVGGRPLLNLSFALDYALHGTEVWGYLAVNLAIHTLAGLLLYGIMRRTLRLPPLGDRFGETSTGLALAAALLWTVHPLQTESVTYLVQRAESLVGLFYLLVVYAVVRGVESPRARGWYATAIAACWLGAITKEVIVTAPIFVLLYDRALWAGSFREALRRRWGLYLGLAASWSLSGYMVLSRKLLSDTVDNSGATAWEYARSQPGVILHYLRLAVWPYPLCLSYEWPVAKTFWVIVPPMLAIGVLVAATLWGLARNRPWALLGAWFFLILALTSSILPIRQLAFEHRMYLPLASVAILAVLGTHALLAGVTSGGRKVVRARPIAIGLLAAAVVGLGVTAHLRNRVYESELTVWRDSAQKAPGNAEACALTASLLIGAGRSSEAREYYVRAMLLGPENAIVNACYGEILMWARDYDPAYRHLSKAVKLAPRHGEIQTAMGDLLLEIGDYRGAVEHYQRAMELGVDPLETQANLAAAMAGSGQFVAAERLCREILSRQPKSPGAHVTLASALIGLGRVREAVEQCEMVLRTKPNHVQAHATLARAISHQDLPRALQHMQAALQADPLSPQLHLALGNLLAFADPAAAASHYREALHLWPDYAEAHFRLAIALLWLGEVKEAIAHLEAAVRHPNPLPERARQQEGVTRR
jgi:tetratricopeptide (TPR) repeat protein